MDRKIGPKVQLFFPVQEKDTDMATRKGWEAARTANEEAKKAAVGSGKYLRLQDDGDSAVVAFLGEPVVREAIWIGNGYEDFDPEKHKGKTPSIKFGICVYNKEHNKLQLFEQSERIPEAVQISTAAAATTARHCPAWTLRWQKSAMSSALPA